MMGDCIALRLRVAGIIMCLLKETQTEKGEGRRLKK